MAQEWPPDRDGEIMTRILVMSDLHLEFQQAGSVSLPDASDYDIVVLAGDIDLGDHGIHWAGEIFACPVVYVPGNHEYYSARFEDVNAALTDAAAEYDHVHLLDNSTVVIDGVRFIGAVLWTDFGLHGRSQLGHCMHAAGNLMNDFQTIRYGTGTLRPANTVDMFNVSQKFIADTLAKSFDGPSVVITHHLPSWSCVATRYQHDLLSAAFASRLDDLVTKSDLWIHGHTHVSVDVDICGTRVVCNPRGYPRNSDQYENPGFDPGFIIEVPA